MKIAFAAEMTLHDGRVCWCGRDSGHCGLTSPGEVWFSAVNPRVSTPADQSLSEKISALVSGNKKAHSQHTPPL